MATNPPEVVPYCPRRGDLLSYTEYNADMRPNEPFTATLRFVSIERGRSAARFVAVDTDTGVQYPIFMKDALDIIRHGVRKGGNVTGTWQVGKRGSNFGLRLVSK